MGRRYINRQGNEEFDQEVSSDGYENRKLERVNDVEDVDPEDFQARQFAVERELKDHKTNEEIVADELKEASHQTRTTNQYQRLVNAHLEDRISKINKAKQAKAQFDKDIDALKNNDLNSIEQLPQKTDLELNSQSMEDTLQTLVSNYNLTKSKLLHFKDRVVATENELVSQKRDIEKIRIDIEKKKVKEVHFENDVNEIKDEIKLLGEKYSGEELKKALETLMDSRE